MWELGECVRFTVTVAVVATTTANYHHRHGVLWRTWYFFTGIFFLDLLELEAI